MKEHAASIGPYKTGPQVSMPFVWDIARYCLELPYGAVRHFPAGTYHEQVATWAGRIELELMSTVHSAWYVFKHKKASEWDEQDQQFVGWVMPQTPPPAPPTHRLNRVIAVLWGMTAWTLRLIGGEVYA